MAGDDFPMNEGIGGPASDLGGWSWSGILATTVDMYGGIGGQMMAAGGMTGMPSQFQGDSGSWTPGTDGSGNTQTPQNRENELLSPNGAPIPPWTSHGSLNPNNPSNLYAAAAGVIASAAANAPHEVNSGLWGVPGFGWSNQFPVDPWRVKWFGPQKAADRYRTMPSRHQRGPRIDPFFSMQPYTDPNDPIVRDDPYEYENGMDYHITPIVSHRDAVRSLRNGDMETWYDYMLPRIPGPANPLDENWPGEDYYWGAGDFSNT